MERRREREGREERRQPPRPAAVWQRDVSRAAAAASNPTHTHVHVHDHRPCHIETLNCRRPVGPCIYLSIYLHIQIQNSSEWIFYLLFYRSTLVT